MVAAALGMAPNRRRFERHIGAWMRGYGPVAIDDWHPSRAPELLPPAHPGE